MTSLPSLNEFKAVYSQLSIDKGLNTYRSIEKYCYISQCILDKYTEYNGAQKLIILYGYTQGCSVNIVYGLLKSAPASINNFLSKDFNWCIVEDLDRLNTPTPIAFGIVTYTESLKFILYVTSHQPNDYLTLPFRLAMAQMLEVLYRNSLRAEIESLCLS